MKALAQHCGNDALDMVDDLDERARIGWLAAVCRDIAAAPRRVDAMKAAVAAHPTRLTYGTLKNSFYAFMEFGEAGLVDQRKVRKPRAANAWVECYQTYCENHNRSNLGGWKAMIDDFWAGVALPHGVGDWRDQWREHKKGRAVPDACPEGWYPKCARYETLQRELCKNPHKDFQIVGSRRGRKAAHGHLTPVLTTRAGLEVGQAVQWDDVTLDVKVRLPGFGHCRPQMFIGYDVASGMCVAKCIRPQYAETPGGKRNSLKERDFRMLHAWWATDVGFHANGVSDTMEWGTTAIRPTLEKQYAKIPCFGNLIRMERSGIMGEQINPGLHKGSGGGNPRRKPLVEQSHRMLHSALAMLPGQVGQDADHQPESLPAMLRYEELITQAESRLTEAERMDIIHELCDYGDFTRIMDRLLDGIWDDPNHRLEGWDGKRVTLWRTGETDIWHTKDELYAMAPEKRELALALIQADPKNVWNRRMTRREAWEAGNKSLVRVPLFNLPLMLDPRPVKEGGDARIVTVRKDGTMGFSDSFLYGQDEVIFHARYTDTRGYTGHLIPERKYMLWTTPWHKSAVVTDCETGKNIIGVVDLYKRAPAWDRDAVMALAGAQNADLARKTMPVRGRHIMEAKTRMAMLGHNADVFRRNETVAVAVSDAGDGRGDPGMDVTDLFGGRVPAEDETADDAAIEEALSVLEECSR